MREEYIRLERLFPIRMRIQAYRLYCRSFPRCERKPFRIILSMWHRGKTDIWLIKEKNQLIGFASTLNSEGPILLDYLAVKEKERGKRYGSRMLDVLKKHYQEKGIFVEIESVYDETSELEQRIRRKRFYENNGMLSMQVLASVFDVHMELLGWNCQLSFDDYRRFYHENYSAFAAEHICKLEYSKH